ncbi:MAG: type II toxin-antitoxin system RelE/ParE family toxin [Janthinobacterium lividum]
MEIESIRHKALRSFVSTGRSKGLPSDAVERLRNMIAYLVAADDVDELRAPPNYGAHLLSGDRAGTWSLVVTRNWRMTFELGEHGSIEKLDLEDYH